jgi:hypothetical protein
LGRAEDDAAIKTQHENDDPEQEYFADGTLKNDLLACGKT